MIKHIEKKKIHHPNIVQVKNNVPNTERLKEKALDNLIRMFLDLFYIFF